MESVESVESAGSLKTVVQRVFIVAVSCVKYI